VFPIVQDGQDLGHVGRRNPQYVDDGKHGPKYLNTADTPLFHKGDQFYIVGDSEHGKAVLVEGPMDAVAVSLATQGAYFGTAPVGTSLTAPQATQLGALDAQPVIATDADAAGFAAAERDFWSLASPSASPLYAALPRECDPADLVSSGRVGTFVKAIDDAMSLGSRLIQSRVLDGHADDLLEATPVIAAMEPNSWSSALEDLADSTGVSESLVRVALASAVRAWNRSPDRASVLWAGQHGSGSGPSHARNGHVMRVGEGLRPPTSRDLPVIAEEPRRALEP